MADFRIQTYRIKTKKLKAGFPLTFVLLADLHNKEYGPCNQRLVDAIKSQKPDGIFLAGDMLIGHSKISCEPAQQLVKILQEDVAQVYYVNGNHESRMRRQKEIYGRRYEEYMAPLVEAGVKILINSQTMLDTAAGSIFIHGYEMDLKYYGKLVTPRFSQQELDAALGEPAGEGYHVLLAHNPVYFDHYAKWGADLTLSGHLHGGIIRLPFIGGVITPQARLFPKYDRGLFEKHGKTLIVSPGLGTHTVNIRFLNPAELSVIRLEGEA